ncbi:MAG: hypothetical protein GY797_06105 [Deltaproteobacteria bacterium]|nr:hypothetical protein [Deltaproteobacteria bacterium]
MTKKPYKISKIVVILSFIMLLEFLTACSTTLKNEGVVCFKRSSQDPNLVNSFISTIDCYSSSCTDVVKRTGEINIDLENSVIQFYSHFVVRDISETVGLCTTDCRGAGEIWFDIESLPAGTYSVKLGKQKLGTLTVPLPSDKWNCVGESS